MKYRLMRYYVDVDGVYIGASDSDEPLSEFPVLLPPQHGSQIWNGNSWSALAKIPFIVNLDFESKVLLSFIKMINNGDIVPGENISEVNLLRKIKDFVELDNS